MTTRSLSMSPLNTMNALNPLAWWTQPLATVAPSTTRTTTPIAIHAGSTDPGVRVDVDHADGSATLQFSRR